jgi:putative ABC transport system permease protein
MRGLRAVAWRNLKRRKLRVALTGLAIALGVANVFGVITANASINREIDRNTESFVGVADVLIVPFDRPGIPQSEVERVRELPGVQQLVLERVWFSLEVPGEGSAWVLLGDLDPDGAELLLTARLKEGRLPHPGQREVALAEVDASLLGVGIGSQVREEVPPESAAEAFERRQEAGVDPELNAVRPDETPLTFLVTGILEDTTDLGSYAIGVSTTVYQPSPVNRIHVILDGTVEPSLWAASHNAGLPGLQLAPTTAPTQLREALTAIQNLLTGSSTLALFVGAFLIYLAFSLALVERTRTYGLLHAVGASRGQVASSVLREALGLGVASIALGLGLGVLLAWGLLGLMAQTGEISYTPPLAATPWSVALGATVGLGATVLGVAVPAIRASTMSPVEAIRGPGSQATRSRVWIMGVALFLAGSAWVINQGIGNNIATQIAVVVVLLGAVLAVPAGVGVFARLMHWIIRRTSPGLGRLAVSHVTREPSRSSYTLALVMVVLAAILTLSASNLSLQQRMDRWIDARFGADLILYGPDALEGVQEVVREVDGVSGVTTVRLGQSVAITSPVQSTENLVLIDPESFFEIAGFPWQDGSDEEARRALAQGGSILIPGGSAHHLGLALGDEVFIAGPDRPQSFVVAGVYDFSGQGRETGVVASVADATFFGEDFRESALYLNFNTGQDRDEVLLRLSSVLSDPDGGNGDRTLTGVEGGRFLVADYVAISGAQIKENARAELDSWIRLFAAVLFIVVIVGTLGMGTTLATSVTLRSREIGTIQAVGTSSAGVVRLVLAESVTLVVAAFGLSLGLGAVLSWMFVEGMNATLGTNLGLVFPWRFLPVLLLFALGIALVAGLLSARRAARLTPVEALRYE